MAMPECRVAPMAEEFSPIPQSPLAANDELDLNPEFLPPNPVSQFKMAAATIPSVSNLGIANLKIDALNM